MRCDADVVVTGAGPAGSVTALLLARAGARVLLLDRHTFPRPKPCGDCLSAGASDVLRRLGLIERVVAVPHARLCGWRIVAPDGRSFLSRFDASANAGEHALAIERAHLDAALLAAAIDAGVEFRPRVHVRDLVRTDVGAIAGVATGRGVLRARAVVGADGLRSVVAKRLGAIRRRPRLHKVSLTARLHAAELASAAGEMHVGDGLVAGIAAVDHDGRCNVTVVADAHRHGRTIAADPAGFAAAALESLPRLRGRLSWSALADVPLLASGPFDRPVRRVVFDGCALAGDAAGYYDPFTGQGIHHALLSAELLAPVLLRALARPPVTRSSLAVYAAQRQQLLRGTRTVQHVIEAIVSRPRLACHAIARLAHTRRFADTLVAVIAGLHQPERLLSPRALLSLLAHNRSLEPTDDDDGRRAVDGRSRAGLLPRCR